MILRLRAVAETQKLVPGVRDNSAMPLPTSYCIMLLRKSHNSTDHHSTMPLPTSYNTADHRSLMPLPTSHNSTDHHSPMPLPTSYNSIDHHSAMPLPTSHNSADHRSTVLLPTSYNSADHCTAMPIQHLITVLTTTPPCRSKYLITVLTSTLPCCSQQLIAATDQLYLLAALKWQLPMALSPSVLMARWRKPPPTQDIALSGWFWHCQIYPFCPWCYKLHPGEFSIININQKRHFQLTHFLWTQ